MAMQPLDIGDRIAQRHGATMSEQTPPERSRSARSSRPTPTMPASVSMRQIKPGRARSAGPTPTDVLLERHPHEGVVDGDDFSRNRLFNEGRVDLELSSNIIAADRCRGQSRPTAHHLDGASIAGTQAELKIDEEAESAPRACPWRAGAHARRATPRPRRLLGHAAALHGSA